MLVTLASVLYPYRVVNEPPPDIHRAHKPGVTTTVSTMEELSHDPVIQTHTYIVCAITCTLLLYQLLGHS